MNYTDFIVENQKDIRLVVSSATPSIHFYHGSGSQL